jgi:hypothetical protein
MTRVDGKKVVGVAVLGITATIAISQIYLPFFMDRSILRDDKPLEERRDLVVMRGAAAAGGSDAAASTAHDRDHNKPSSKSMWQNMKRSRDQ